MSIINKQKAVRELILEYLEGRVIEKNALLILNYSCIIFFGNVHVHPSNVQLNIFIYIIYIYYTYIHTYIHVQYW
jgi:hypothetical protein